MESLIEQVPPMLFWGLIVGWVLGALTAWRFARHLERLRDAVRQAKHHYRRAADFVTYARSNVASMLYAGGFFVAVLGVVGWLAWSRVAGT